MWCVNEICLLDGSSRYTHFSYTESCAVAHALRIRSLRNLNWRIEVVRLSIASAKVVEK